MASATLIGDVLGSRAARDRARLHAALTEVLARSNAAWAPVTPLRITVGDEYQGVFATLGAALQVALRLRLALLPDHDVRQGLGWGAIEVLEDEPRVEDGPAWWAAREAIEAVKQAERAAPTRWRRTAYRRADAVAGPDPAAVEAALLLRDSVVASLSDRSVSVLRGLLEGRTQRDIAADLGITASAVSQRVHADGLHAVVLADELLGGVR